MSRRNETTSKKVASKAASALRDPKAGKREKSLAGSALTQVASPVDERYIARVERAFVALYLALDRMRGAFRVRMAKRKAKR